jgi:hypothetical protein
MHYDHTAPPDAVVLSPVPDDGVYLVRRVGVEPIGAIIGAALGIPTVDLIIEPLGTLRIWHTPNYCDLPRPNWLADTVIAGLGGELDYRFHGAVAVSTISGDPLPDTVLATIVEAVALDAELAALGRPDAHESEATQ